MWFMYGGDSACVTHNVKWFLDTIYQDSWAVHDGFCTLCDCLSSLLPA